MCSASCRRETSTSPFRSAMPCSAPAISTAGLSGRCSTEIPTNTCAGTYCRPTLALRCRSSMAAAPNKRRRFEVRPGIAVTAFNRWLRGTPSFMSVRAIGLLRLDLGGLDHLGPFLHFDLHLRGEFLRAIADRLEAELRQALPHIRLRNDLDDFPVKQRDDVLRRTGGNENPDPGVAIEVGIAGLGNRGQVRKRLRSVVAHH